MTTARRRPRLDHPARRAALGHAARLAALLATCGAWPAVAAAQAAAAPAAGGWSAAAFDARSLPEAARALGAAGAPVESREVTLQGPDIAENGAAVQVQFGSTAAGVRRLLLLVEKNPNLLSAVFDVTEAVEPFFTTRVKMAESSNVYAVALLSDGRTLFARREIRVTMGGCGA